MGRITASSLLKSVWTELFLGRHNTHVYSPQIGSPPQIKVQTPPKFTLMNQQVLSGLHRNMGEGLIRGAERTQSITKAHPNTGGSSQSWEPGTHWTACGQLHRLDSGLCRCLSGSKALPGSSDAFSSFQAAALVSVFFAAQLLSLWSFPAACNV